MALELDLKEANVYKTTSGHFTFGFIVKGLDSDRYNLTFRSAVPVTSFLSVLFHQLRLR